MSEPAKQPNTTGRISETHIDPAASYTRRHKYTHYDDAEVGEDEDDFIPGVGRLAIDPLGLLHVSPQGVLFRDSIRTQMVKTQLHDGGLVHNEPDLAVEREGAAHGGENVIMRDYFVGLEGEKNAENDKIFSGRSGEVGKRGGIGFVSLPQDCTVENSGTFLTKETRSPSPEIRLTVTDSEEEEDEVREEQRNEERRDAQGSGIREHPEKINSFLGSHESDVFEAATKDEEKQKGGMTRKRVSLQTQRSYQILKAAVNQASLRDETDSEEEAVDGIREKVEKVFGDQENLKGRRKSSGVRRRSSSSSRRRRIHRGAAAFPNPGNLESGDTGRQRNVDALVEVFVELDEEEAGEARGDLAGAERVASPSLGTSYSFGPVFFPSSLSPASHGASPLVTSLEKDPFSSPSRSATQKSLPQLQGGSLNSPPLATMLPSSSWQAPSNNKAAARAVRASSAFTSTRARSKTPPSTASTSDVPSSPSGLFSSFFSRKGKTSKMQQMLDDARFDAEVKRPGNHMKLSVQLFRRPTGRQLYKLQRGKCAQCYNQMDTSLLSKEPLYCHYTGKGYCKRCLDLSDPNVRHVIPGKLLNKMDTKKYKVCSVAGAYLSAVYTMPTLTISRMCPNLYKHSVQLQYARALRMHLSHMHSALLVCPFREDWLKLLDHKEHLLAPLPWTNPLPPPSLSASLPSTSKESTTSAVVTAEVSRSYTAFSSPGTCLPLCRSLMSEETLNSDNGGEEAEGGGGWLGSVPVDDKRRSSGLTAAPSSHMNSQKEESTSTAPPGSVGLRDIYSAEEVVGVLRGSFCRWLQEKVKILAAHVESGSCASCSQFSSICGCCDDKDAPVYGFNSEVVCCSKCHQLFHSRCFDRAKCSGCLQRLQARQQIQSRIARSAT